MGFTQHTSTHATRRTVGFVALVLAAVGLLAAAPAQSAATKTWDGAGDGVSWSDATNWNPDGVPTSGDTVELVDGDAVTLAETSDVGALVLTGGSLTLDRGVLAGTDVTLSGGDLALTTTSGNVLRDVTMHGDPTWAVGEWAAVGGTLTIDGTLTTASRLYNEGNAVIAGGTLELHPGASLYGDGEGSLTIAADAVVRASAGTRPSDGATVGGCSSSCDGSQAVINEGLIEITAPGELDVSGAVDNRGTVRATAGQLRVENVSTAGRVEASGSGKVILGGEREGGQSSPYLAYAVDDVAIGAGGHVQLDGDWTNTGTITNDGGTLELAGEFTTPDLGTYTRTGDVTTLLTGAADNAGQTWDLEATAGTVTLATGASSVTGGTVLPGSTATLTLLDSGGRQGHLEDVTVDGDLDLAATAGSLGLGGTVTVNGRLATGSFTTLFAFDDVTLDAATVDLTGGGDISIRPRDTATGRLTLPARVELRTDADGSSGFSILESTIAWSGSSGAQLTVAGSIVSGGGTLTIAELDTRLTGAVTATGGGTVRVRDVREVGAVTADAGTVLLDSTAAYGLPGATVANGGRLELAGDWTNTGTITSTDATVDLAGDFTPSDIGTYVRSGDTVTEVSGTVTNTGGRWDLAATTGPLLLDRGTIDGGTVVTSATDGLSPTNQGLCTDTLSGGVTIEGPLDARETNGDLCIEGGLTVTDTLSTGHGELLFVGGGTLTTPLLDLTGGGDVGTYAGDTLTFAPSTTVVSSSTTLYGATQLGRCYGSGCATDTTTIVNLGTVRATGDEVEIRNRFDNQGLVEAAGGDVILFDGFGYAHTDGTLAGRWYATDGVIESRVPGTVRRISGEVLHGDGSSQLRIRDGGSLDSAIDGTLELVSGALTVGDGATVTTAPGGLELTGTLRGAGTVVGSVRSAGAVAPGESIGTLTIDGDLTLDPAGALDLELDPAALDTEPAGAPTDRLVVTGDATIGGALALDQLSDPDPARAYDLTVLDAATVTGSFAGVTDADTADGRAYTPTYDAGAVRLVLGEPAADPATLSVTVEVTGGATAGDDATVTATVRNTGGSDATDVSADLTLPAALTLVTGDDPATLGTIAPGAEATATWTVRTPDTCRDETYDIDVTATAADAASATGQDSLTTTGRGSTGPDAGDLRTTGCWVQRTTGVYVTDDPATVNGLELDPSTSGATIEVDTTTTPMTLTTTDVVDVAVRLDGDLPTSLGTATFDWPLDAAAAVAPSGDLYGLPVDALSVRVSGPGAVALGVTGRLPAVLGGTPASGTWAVAQPSGLDSSSVAVTGDADLIEIARVEGTTLTFRPGLGDWAVAGAASLGPAAVTGAVALDDGSGLATGTLDLTLPFAGLHLDTATIGAATAGRWTTAADSPVGLDLTFDATGLTSGAYVPASPISLGGVVEVGVSEWQHDSGAWRLIGSNDLSGVTDTTVSGQVSFVDGLPTTGALTTAESELGTLATLDAFTLTYRSGRVDTTWDLGGTGPLPGGNATVDGYLRTVDASLDTGAVELSRLPLGGLVEVADLGLAYDVATGAWDVSGDAAPGPVELPVDGSLEFDDGALVSGSTVTVPAVGFGPVDLTGLTMTATAGSSFDLLATVALPGGPVGATGSLDLVDGDATAGTLALDRLAIGGLLATPGPVALSLSDIGTDGRGDRFSVAGLTPGGDARGVLDVSLDVAGGQLVAGDIEVGGLQLGEWIDVDAFTLTSPDGGPWNVGGTLTTAGANTTLGGSLALAGGRATAGSLDLTDLGLGESYRFGSLRLVPDGTGAFDLDGRVTADELPVAGRLEVVDGALAEASIAIADLPVGEWLGFDGVDIAYSAAGVWTIAGTLGSGWDATPFGGQFTFVDGQLQAGVLSLTRVPLGPSTIEDLQLAYYATLAGVDAWEISGRVATPDHLGDGTEAIGLDSRLTLEDGRLRALRVELPWLEVGGLYHLQIRDTVLELVTGTADGIDRFRIEGGVGGGSRDRTGSWRIPGTLDVSYTDGALVGGRLELGSPGTPDGDPNGVSLGGLVYVDELVLEFQSGDRWSVSGSFGPGTTPVSGSLDLRDRRITGGSMTLGDMQLGSLATVQELTWTFDEQLPDPTDPGDEGISSPATRFAITGQARFGETGETTADLGGTAVLHDGGLRSASLSLAELPLGELLTLQRFQLAYGSDDTVGAADPDALRTWSLNAEARHQGGLTSVDGSARWNQGSMERGSLDIADVPFGPVTLTQLELDFDALTGATDTWSASGAVSHPDGTSAIGGTVSLLDGEVLDADLTIEEISVGEVLLVESLTFTKSTTAEGDLWSGAAAVSTYPPATGSGDATVDLTFSDGVLVAGRVAIPEVRWGGLLRVDDVLVVFDDATSRWDVSGAFASGETTVALAGWLELADGVATSGNLTIDDLAVAELVHLEAVNFTVVREASETAFDVTGTAWVGDGAATDVTGAAAWRGGRLDRLDLRIPTASLGDTVRFADVDLSYDAGTRWALSGAVVGDDRRSSFSGSFDFDDGRPTAGSLGLRDVPFGPVELDTFDLTVASASGGVVTFDADAVLEQPNGDTTRFAGDLDLDGGAVTAASLTLADGAFVVGDLVVFDTLTLGMEQIDDGDRWFASAATGSDRAGGTADADLEIVLDGGSLVRGSVSVDRLYLTPIIQVDDLALTYAAGGAAWAVSGTVSTSPDTSVAVAGSLSLQRDRAISGSVVVNPDDPATGEPTGDGFEIAAGLFTLEQLELTLDPGTDGGTSRFAVGGSATLRGADAPTGLGGHLELRGDQVRSFSLEIAELPLGDLATLEQFRLGYVAADRLEISAETRFGSQETPTVVGGFLQYARSGGAGALRLSGGQLELGELPLGIVQLRSFTLSANIAEPSVPGRRTWGVSGEVASIGSETDGGEVGGSLVLEGGAPVGGSLTLTRIPLGLFDIEDVELAVQEVDAGLRLDASTTAADVTVGGGLTLARWTDPTDGSSSNRVVTGALEFEDLTIAELITIDRFSLDLQDVAVGRWSGALELSPPPADDDTPTSTGSALAVRMSFVDGRLDSGYVGVDTSVGGSGPVAAGLGAIPLKELGFGFERTAEVGGETLSAVWRGSIGLELPGTTGVVGGELIIADSAFHSASLSGAGLGVVIQPGVVWNRVGAGYQADPLRITGSAGFDVAAASAKLASMDVDLTFEELDDLYRFAIDGTLTLLPQVPVITVGEQQGGAEIRSNGYVRIYSEFNADVIVASVTMDLEGQLDFSGELRDPVTGEAFDPLAFQLSLDGEAEVLFKTIGEVSGVVNNVGLSGCGRVGDWDLGFGIRFDGTDRFAGGCQMSSYRLRDANDPKGEPVAGSTVVSGSSFDVPDVAFYSALFRGDGQAPEVTLVAPSGARYTNPVDTGDVLSGIAGQDTIFILRDPEVGTWTVEDVSYASSGARTASTARTARRAQASSTRTPGEALLLESLPLPPIGDIAVAVTGDGSQRTLDYDFASAPGQTVVLHEEQDDDVTATIAVVSSSGTTKFTPDGGPDGGSRRIIATVYQDGRFRDQRVVATYTAPAARPPSAPRDLQVREIDGGVQVTWSPPADTGGRPLRGYQVWSTAGGASVLTDGTVANLRLPGVDAGGAYQVVVRARTMAGEGDAAVSSVRTASRDFPLDREPLAQPGDETAGPPSSPPGTSAPDTDPELATDDVVLADEATPLEIDVLANDGDDAQLDGVDTAPDRGSVEVVGDRLRYTPAPGNGTDRFRYRVTGPDGTTDTADVEIVVEPLGDLSQACPEGVAGDGFSDVADDATHGEAIRCLQGWGIADGRGDGTYGPGDRVRRDQLASLVARALESAGVVLPTDAPDAFDDDTGNVHATAIDQLAALGVVAGTGDRRYSPSDPVTRGQFATMLVQADALVTGRSPSSPRDWFTDDDGSVHEDSIDVARDLAIALGTSTDRYEPGGLTSRAQIASFVARLLDRWVEAGDASPPT